MASEHIAGSGGTNGNRRRSFVSHEVEVRCWVRKSGSKAARSVSGCVSRITSDQTASSNITLSLAIEHHLARCSVLSSGWSIKLLTRPQIHRPSLLLAADAPNAANGDHKKKSIEIQSTEWILIERHFFYRSKRSLAMNVFDTAKKSHPLRVFCSTSHEHSA